VLEAGDADMALRLTGAELAIDLVITDMVLPGTNGRALAESLSALRPGLQIIYMSGYSDIAVPSHGGGPHGMFLPKPFTKDVLLRTVELALRPQQDASAGTE
jgi:DNA-binding NtrC family response regulator